MAKAERSLFTKSSRICAVPISNCGPDDANSTVFVAQIRHVALDPLALNLQKLTIVATPLEENAMKSAASRIALTVAFLGSLAFVGLTAAQATTVTWVLSSPHNTSHYSEAFHALVGGTSYEIDAAGYSGTWSSPSSLTQIDLYNKYTPGNPNETGLGIASDHTGENEIWTNTLVRIDTTTAQSQGLTNFSFTMGSTTQGEAWSVFGSNAANSGLVSLYSNETTESIPYSLDPYNFYYFTYSGPPLTYGWKEINNKWRWVETSNCGGCNVLLTSLAASTASAQIATPLPASLPLFTSGLGVIGLFGFRRKRKARAAA